MWAEYTRIIKPNGVIALHCDGLFMAQLMLSNPKMWRYNLVWDKVMTTGFLNANRMPLRRTEEIAIFYKSLPTYNPQKVKGNPNHAVGKAVGQSSENFGNNNYGKFTRLDTKDQLGDMKHPTSLLTFPKVHPSVTIHPTQKPVELAEWIIKTYTNPGDTVLDNCMGSGTAGVACKMLDRKFIGMELDEHMFEVAKKRIDETHEPNSSF